MPSRCLSRRPPLRLPGHSLIRREVLDLDDGELARVVGGLTSSEGFGVERAHGLGATASCGYTSCFVVGTLIATEVGPVPVEALAPFSMAPRLLRPSGPPARIATGAAGPEAAAIVELELLTGQRLSVSEYHPFPARTRGVDRGRTVPARSLRSGQELQVLDAGTRQLTWTPITALARRSYDGLVYNVCLAAPETPRDHRLLANGIVTGDLFSQLCLVESVRIESVRRLRRGEPIGPLAEELAVSEAVLDEWCRAYRSAPQALEGESRLVRAALRAAHAS